MLDKFWCPADRETVQTVNGGLGQIGLYVKRMSRPGRTSSSGSPPSPTTHRWPWSRSSEPPTDPTPPGSAPRAGQARLRARHHRHDHGAPPRRRGVATDRWLVCEADRMQRAADAAALAGVVWLPNMTRPRTSLGRWPATGSP
jgi:hypothetical protein